MIAPEDQTVAYLTKRFPRLSETFILDEILGLEEAGVPLRLYAGGNPCEPVVQPDVERVASAVTYLHRPGRQAAVVRAREAILAHVLLIWAEPRRYVGALAYAARRPDRRTAIRHLLDAGRLVRMLKRDRARHLHAAFAHTPASIAHYVHLLTGLPFSFAGHAKDLYTSEPAALAERAAAAEFVLVCSASAAQELERRAGPRARIVLQYHGVDSHRFMPAEPVAADGRPISILAVGRLVEKKGYPVLLDALAQVAAVRSVTCEVIGAGKLEPELRAQIARLGLQEVVTLRGELTHQEIAAAYGRSQVFVQASVVLGNGDRDGIPNALLEAMASGLPVLATRVAGIPEVVTNGVNGLLVEPGDADALAAALTTLVDDPELRVRLGASARAHVVSELDRQVCTRRVAGLMR